MHIYKTKDNCICMGSVVQLGQGEQKRKRKNLKSYRFQNGAWHGVGLQGT